MRFFYSLIIVFSIFTKTAFTQEISEKAVIESALKFYPKILAYYEKVESSNANFLEAQGFFDIKLKQNYSDRTRGYYDSKLADIIVEKQSGFLGNKSYLGYRKSFNEFPVQENGSYTNRGGEYRFGTKFSLLQGSSIDQERLSLALAKLGIEESKVQLESIKMEIATDAMKAYWQWIVASEIYKIYENLYQLALERQNQIELSIKKGAVAAITSTENKKNILHRKNSLIEAKAKMENAAKYLSLFWRNQDGEPFMPKYSEKKITFETIRIEDEKIKHDLQNALEARPDLRIIKIKKSAEQKNLEYAKNLMKPRLDVDISASKDLGNGSAQRAQANNSVNLEFEMPLQRSKAKGMTLDTEAKIQAIKHEETLLEQKVSVELQQIKTSINSILEIFENLKEEVTLLEILEKAEREKFRQGLSMLLIVNIREQDSADARIAKILMFEKYKSTLADYKMASFRLE